MNALPATIRQVISSGNLSVVEACVEEDCFALVVLDTPQTAAYLQAGQPVRLLFNENEVLLAKNWAGDISTPNRLGCRVTAMQQGDLFCRVRLQYRGFGVTSVITGEAAGRLALAPGDEVTAFINTSEITLSPV
ncbi:MAG TPA: TOBE domain-containing protein [Chitinophagaceae bacterium]|nr:TOBE domain-containing protein [Chitinophagaceae bacterium]